MTYDDFVLKCIELAPSETKELGYNPDAYWGRRWETVSSYYRKEYKDTKYVFRVEYETGGYSGGSCWGGTAEGYTSKNPPSDFKEFDIVLEHFVSNLSYLQYKNLYNSLIEEDSYTQHEYYGNSTNYAIKQIELRKLYDYMKEKGWLS